MEDEKKKEEITVSDDYEVEIEKFKKIIDKRNDLKKYREILLKKGVGFSFVVLSKVKNKKGKFDGEGLRKVYKMAGEKGDFVLVYDCAKLLGKRFVEKAREFTVKEAKADKTKLDLAMKMFLANEDEEGVRRLSS